MRAKKIGIQGKMAENALVLHQDSASFKNSNKQPKLLKKIKNLFTKVS